MRNFIRTDPKVDAFIRQHIRDGLEDYALRFDPESPPSSDDLQLNLPFCGGSRSLPLGMFPIDICELFRQFCRNGCIRLFPGSMAAPGGQGKVIAYSEWISNDLGRVPIIHVQAEHLDDAEIPTPVGRFGALRETARFILADQVELPTSSRTGYLGLSAETNGGEFLAPDFFEDPLNRWAMCLGCPEIELKGLLLTTWGTTPVTPRQVENMGPLYVAAAGNRPEAVFLSAGFRARSLDEHFGLSPNAVVAWCRFLNLIEV